VNRQKQGEIPDHIIDFSTEKLILVYDLGGGTLDVSLHSVNFNNPDDPLINIEDIAISRYTDIGGDNFDEKLTDVVFERYLDEYNLKLGDYSNLEIEYAKTTLFYFAESFKRMITNDALRREEMFEKYEPEEVIQSLMAGYLLDQNPLSMELSLQEYKQIMSDFLASDIKYPLKSNINDRLGEKNLISPILDVLNKAFKKKNMIIKPDIILLSGGMTKLPMVRERLANFFGMEPQTIPDPDKAVSRGASIYHYYLHQEYRPTAILAEPIYMIGRDHKTRKKKLIELVPAGTTLPYNQEFTFKSEGKQKAIDIPLCRTDENHRLSTTRFKLSKQYPPNTLVQAKVYVNLLKVLEVEAWIKDNPLEKTTISIDINGKTEEKSQKVLSAEKSTKQRIEEKRQKVKKKEKTSLDVLHIQLKKFFNSIPSTGRPNYTVLTENDILKAKNIDSVIKSLLKIQRKTHHKIREKILLLLGDIVSNTRVQMNFPNSILNVLHNMIRYVKMIRNLSNPNPKEINLAVRYAIETIGKSKTIDLQREVIDSLIDWVDEPIFRKIRNAILISMGKLPPDNEILKFLVGFISKPQQKHTLIPSLWALGKQGSRDLTNPILIDYLGNIHEIILKMMKESEDFEIIQYIAYAMLEICKLNPEHPENCFSDEIRKSVILEMGYKVIDLEKPFKNKRFNHLDRRLKDWGRFLNTKKWVNLSIQAFKGLEITGEEMELLDEFRKR